MRAARERDAPMRHGAFRILLGRFLKRPDGRAVIEPMVKGQALIEIALRFRRGGGDFVFVGTEPFEKRFLRPNDSSVPQHSGQRKRVPGDTGGCSHTKPIYSSASHAS